MLKDQVAKSKRVSTNEDESDRKVKQPISRTRNTVKVTAKINIVEPANI